MALGEGNATAGRSLCWGNCTPMLAGVQLPLHPGTRAPMFLGAYTPCDHFATAKS